MKQSHAELAAIRSGFMGVMTERHTDVAKLQITVNDMARVVGTLANPLIEDHKGG